ncbi:MAG: hypothetical protein JKY53_15170 [Flavobacteriales bacterium]|nr:hypothetical protein [Flavobacteriales bacterium]
MKNYTLLLLFTAVSINAQQTSAVVEKGALGINKDAPKGVYQYAFRIGEWETSYKTRTGRDTWEVGSGTERFYVAKNGVSFIEEIIDKKGELESTIFFKYNNETDSWINTYKNVKTGTKTIYTAKLIDGKLTEILQRSDHVNNNVYEIINDSTFTYTCNRAYTNGLSYINYIGTSNKQSKPKK